MRSIIKIDHLNKCFNDVKAVQNLSFCVKEGELFAFLGINGAGKSTTINIMCGQLSKDSGTVEINSVDLDQNPNHIKRELGVVFQNSVLDAPLSVFDNLRSRAAVYGIQGAKFSKRLTELGSLWMLLTVARCVCFLYGEWDTIWNAVLYYSQGWIGVLAMLGLGKRFLDHSRRFTKFFIKAEFPMYLFHQTVIVVLAYWVVSYGKMAVFVQYIVIMTASFVISYAMYLVAREFSMCRRLFGIKR